MSLSLDRESYYRRIKRLYTGWKREGSTISEQDAILCAVGQNEEDQYRYLFNMILNHIFPSSGFGKSFNYFLVNLFRFKSGYSVMSSLTQLSVLQKKRCLF